MKRHYAETKAQKQADWLARFSDAVTAFEPRHAGRIDWPTAVHLFFSGMTPTEAAHLYVENRKEQ